jgi:hypothetical protein
MRSLSGQSLVFEQVLLFGIGVAIFVALFAVFTMYQNYFASVNLNNQLDEVKDLIVSNIMKLVEKGNVTAYVSMDIPRRISDEGYEIALSNSGLNLTSLVTGVYKFSSLYGLNQSYNMTGTVPSALGRFIIYKKENKIILS